MRSNVFYTAIEKMIIKHINPKMSSLDSNANRKLPPVFTSHNKPNSSFVNKELDSLIVFLFRFIGFKPKYKKKFEDEDEIKGEQIQSWMYNYSHPKFSKIWSIPQFRIIFNYIYSFHLERMLEEDSTLANWRNEYLEAFRNLHNKLQIIEGNK